jgi:predicted O-methyltransferase YrrM
MPGDDDGYDLLFTDKGDGAYPSYLRGALVLLHKLGVAGAGDALDWLEDQMFPAVATGFGWDRKWTMIG